jgi:hypothetical protein
VFEPTHFLAIEGEIGPFRALVAYVLEPMEGATRLENAEELEPSSAVSRLLAPLAIPKVAESLGVLKASPGGLTTSGDTGPPQRCGSTCLYPSAFEQGRAAPLEEIVA